LTRFAQHVQRARQHRVEVDATRRPRLPRFAARGGGAGIVDGPASERAGAIAPTRISSAATGGQQPRLSWV
jgi:hypothetical protein